MSVPALAIVPPDPARVKLQVVAVGLDHTSLTAVKAALASLEHSSLSVYSDLAGALKDSRLASGTFDAGGVIFILDFEDARHDSSRTATEIQKIAGPRSAVIAVSSKAEPQMILNAMRAGCNEYLTKPLDAEQLLNAVKQSHLRWSEADTQAQRKGGRVIGVLGARGGAGTTTIAAHLAFFMTRLHNKKVVLVDQHRQLGHAALLFGVDSPAYHFYDAVRSVDRLDASLLSSLVNHHSSGVDLLASPTSFDIVEDVSLYDVELTLRFLAQCYEYVVIDCSPRFTDEMFSVLGCCDEIYLVATQDVPALRDVSRYVELLQDHHIPSDKVKVVVNRYTSDRSLTRQQIESAIRRPVSICVPTSTSELSKAIDSGSPVAPDRRIDFVRAIRQWVTSLVPAPITHTSSPKRRFLFWG